MNKDQIYTNLFHIDKAVSKMLCCLLFGNFFKILIWKFCTEIGKKHTSSHWEYDPRMAIKCTEKKLTLVVMLTRQYIYSNILTFSALLSAGYFVEYQCKNKY